MNAVQKSRVITMATDDTEPVAGPSSDSSHVMPVTSQLPLCVQQLNNDNDFDCVDDNIDEHDTANGADAVTVTDHNTMSDVTSVFAPTIVLLSLLFLFAYIIGKSGSGCQIDNVRVLTRNLVRIGNFCTPVEKI